MYDLGLHAARSPRRSGCTRSIIAGLAASATTTPGGGRSSTTGGRAKGGGEYLGGRLGEPRQPTRAGSVSVGSALWHRLRSTRRQRCVGALWTLNAQIRQPAQPTGQVPVPPTEQRHPGRDEHRSNDRRVEQDSHG